MLQALIDVIGAPNLVVNDTVMFVTTATIFLFCVAETFSLIRLVVDRLSGKRLTRK